MAVGRMVPLATVPGGFEAKVLAARLGAAGVVWQLRGSVDGPYPMGPVTVLVSEADFHVARELLLVDEIEAAFAPSDDRSPAPRAAPRIPRRRRGWLGRWRRWLALSIGVSMAAGPLARAAQALA